LIRFGLVANGSLRIDTLKHTVSREAFPEMEPECWLLIFGGCNPEMQTRESFKS
jgi:hypothetical protein